MKKFWAFHIVLSVVLLLVFATTLYFGVANDNVTLISVSNYVMYLAIIHFFVCVLMSIINIRKQTFWALLFLSFIGILCIVEFFSFYGILAGMLGDM